MPPPKAPSEEVKELFKRSAPETDAEKLANFRDTRAAMTNSPVALAHATRHHLAAKRAGAPKPTAKATPKPAAKPAPKKPVAKAEVPDEGGSAAAFDDLKELNTFAAQEDQALAAQLDGEAVVKEIGKSLGKAINPDVKNGDAKWAKK